MDVPDRDPHEERSGLRRVVGVAMAALFLLGIVAPGLVALLSDGHMERARASVLEEKRPPVEFPEPPSDWGAGLQAWPRAFEAWWNDAFGLRTTLIRWHNLARLLGFGVTPGPSVLLGHDEAGEPWLYTSIQTAVDDARGALPFSEPDLRRWQRVLEQRRDWLAGNDCRYLFVVAPNKSSIYPEYMPSALGRVGDATRLDQLVAWMDEHSTVEVLDLRPALLEAKGQRIGPVPASARLYFRLGTHWNGFGAWVGHREVMKALDGWFPRMWPTPLSLYRLREAESGGDSWATRFHVDDVVTQSFPVLRYVGPPAVRDHREEQGLLVYESEAGGPTCVLLRDSFATHLAPHLAPHFGRLVLVWNQVRGPEFTVEMVSRQKPDLVIEEVVERYLAGTTLPELPSTPRFR